MQKRFAITGATGLLGSNLVNRLVEMGQEINVLIKDHNSKTVLDRNVTKTYGDISNKNDIEFFIQKSRPTHFIHLAAQTQAYDSLKYPYQTFYNNVIGTLNILESLREYENCVSIIIASSDKAYGELIGDKYFENHPLNGIYPYDASKSSTDIISNSYRLTYGLPITVTRACNIYGIGDYNQQRLIPGILYAYQKNLEFVLRNGGVDFREYVHVEDVIEAYLLIIDYSETHHDQGAFNISSGDAWKTIDLFNRIQEEIGSPIKHRIIENRSLEILNQFMDSSLLIDKTGWKPRFNIQNSINEICKWYLQNY